MTSYDTKDNSQEVWDLEISMARQMDYSNGTRDQRSGECH